MRQADIEGGRAKFALDAVKKVYDDKEMSEKAKKEYKSYCRKFPTYILTNGLAASIAFAFEKGREKEDDKNDKNGKKVKKVKAYKLVARIR